MFDCSYGDWLQTRERERKKRIGRIMLKKMPRFLFSLVFGRSVVRSQATIQTARHLATRTAMDR
jgi:hypothetical protein